MAFRFNEAFPALKLKERAALLLEDTVVTRVTTPKTHDYLNVYLESDHIITKDIIREAEREIKKQVINNVKTQVRIYETFVLSKETSLKSVYEEYSDSALIEIEETSILYFNMMRTAKVSFESDEKMVVSLGDIPVYHAKEKEFAALLEDIYIKRFGAKGIIEYVYHEVSIGQKNDEDFMAEINAVSERLRKAEASFIGASEKDSANSEGGAAKKVENWLKKLGLNK